MLTQTCTQCHKQHLAEESLHNAKGQAFCSAYCLKAATGKPVAPELPPKKTLPLVPIVLAFACGFWLFWRVLAPSEVVDNTLQEPLNLSDNTQVEQSSLVGSPREQVPERRPPDLSESPDATAPGDEASLAPQTGDSADKTAKTEAENQSTKAFALARQAALLLPMDAPRAAVLARESVTLYPNREAYRVLIQYAQDKDRAFEKEAYLKSCLGLTTDRKSADYCYIDKAPEEDATPSEEDLFAPLPEPSLDAARRVSPPRLNESLSDSDP